LSKYGKVAAIIPAAGAGNRLREITNTPKQFFELHGKPILAHTLQVFEDCDAVDSVVVVVPKNSIQTMWNQVLGLYEFQKIVDVVAGGETRQESVGAGMKELSDAPPEIVIVHDGVRPFVTVNMVQQSVESARQYGAAVVGISAVDTIKKVLNHRIQATIDRSVLWYAQTPQTFKYSLLKSAFEKAAEDHFIGTDEAMLVEHLGEPIATVEGSQFNFKITTPAHLILAETLLDHPEFRENI